MKSHKDTLWGAQLKGEKKKYSNGKAGENKAQKVDHSLHFLSQAGGDT